MWWCNEVVTGSVLPMTAEGGHSASTNRRVALPLALVRCFILMYAEQGRGHIRYAGRTLGGIG